MKLPRKFLIGLILAFVSNLTFAQLEELPIERISEQLHKKYEIFDGQWPKYTEDGKWIFRKEVNWFSGFIGGELWNMFEITGDEKMKNRAIAVADSLLDYAGIDYTHDMGFIFLPSVYRAYKFTGAKKYKDALILAAEMLAKRFNSKGNFIRAWGKLGTDDNEGTMIIDTMMNLKLLFIIAKITGNTDLYDIAYKHAITCMNQHVRQNFSSYHVVGFDPASGEVVKRYTHQGFEDESTWARGQAWGIYGFAIAYKFTGDQRFLKTSTEMAKYFIERLPEDFVPYWDLDLSGNDVLKDASAGAIAASGMYLLSELTPSKQNYVIFTETARKIAYSLITKYTFLNSNRETEEGLQIHCIYNYNRGNAIDESYPCGDYYFTEILLKYYNDLNGLSINPSQKRTRINLNKNWFYLEDNIRNYKDLQLSNSDWERIDLPHSWNKFDAFDQIPGYRRDASWYQKIIQLDEINIEKEYYLTFEGANLKTELFVNGKFVGEHIGGYVGFQFDITSILKNGKNEIFVRVDNSIDKYLIPSQQSDFFISGGINRDVYLDVIPAQNFSSLKISTPNVSEKSATLSLDLNVRHFTKGMTILAVLVDPNNIVVQEKEFAEVGTENSLSMDEVDNPDLWSTENPSLYTIKLQLKKDNNIIDEIEETFGFRWFEFEKNGPFYLNGKRVLLRGTHRHEDHAGFANAIPNEIHRQDIEMIKSMGANFIRLGHYPQDPEIYKACDELGILVWDELPWCRGGVGDAKWKANAKRLFAAMINQNYNHPSIILWSVGNEIYWLPEFEGGGEVKNLNSFVSELHNLAHKIDPYRLTSIRKYYEGSSLVDVFSPSIWAGWYSGVYTSYGKAIDDAIEKYDHFLHAEYGGSSHLGRHSETPITGEGLLNPDEWAEDVNQVRVQNIAKIGDWSESYIVDLFDWHLSVSEAKEQFVGNAQWAFKDFGTPLRPENSVPYLNQKGLVDRAGNPKDAFYVFKSYWNENDKFIYIESHSWLDRNGPESLERDITVYSNCDEVELIVNRKSLGLKNRNYGKFPAHGLVWSANFVEGENEIVALSKQNGTEIRDSIKINYSFEKPEKPEQIVLSKERLSNGNFLVTAKMIDKNGKLCLDYNDKVYFSLSGAGELLENYGTYTRNSVIEFANGKASIEYKAVPFEEGIIEARNQDFKGSWIIIKL